MAQRDIPVEFGCGCCYQEFNCMTDPKQLSCHHIFCLVCLQADYRTGVEFRCPTCQTTNLIERLEDLPSAKLETEIGSQMDTTSLKCDCEICEGQTALRFCIDCGYKMCETHQKMHDSLFGRKHRTVSIATYALAPNKYRKVLCEVHGEEITLGCSFGDKVGCELCKTDKKSNQCQDPNKEYHMFCPLSELDEEISAYAKGLLDKSSTRLTEICKLEKHMWGVLDDEEVECRKKIALIERARDEQIEKIRKESEQMKEQVYEYQRLLTDQVELNSSELLDKDDQLKTSSAKVHRWLRESHVTEKVRQKQQMTEELVRNITSNLGCQLTAKLLLSTRAEPRACNLELLTVPTSLTLSPMAWYDTGFGSTCLSVNHTSNGHLLISLANGVLLMSRGNRKEVYRGTWSSVTAVAKDHVRYVMHAVGGNHYRLDLCMRNFQQSQGLLRVGILSEIPAYMAVSDRFIAVTNPGQKFLTLFAFAGNVVKNVNTEDYCQSLHFLPNENLLASTSADADGASGAVVRYHIENEKLSVVWKCEGLDKPHGICADSYGLIYVCSRSEASPCVFILSAEGKRVGVLTHNDIPSDSGHISIWEDELAVPCASLQIVKKFRINR